MAEKNLEAQLVITAADKTGAVFNQVGARLDRLAGAGRRVGAVGRDFLNVASAVDKTGLAMSRTVAQAERLLGQLARMPAKAREMDTLGRRIGTLGAPLAAGYAAYESARFSRTLADHAVSAAVEGQHERVRMEAAGMLPDERRDAEVTAARLSSEFTPLSQTELLHMLRNVRSITGSFATAAKVVEPLARLRIIAQGAHPAEAEEMASDFDQLVKGLEIKGVTLDPVKFTSYLQGMAKAINVFGDTLRPTDYYKMFKYGSASTQALSQQFMLKTAPTFAQEMGGSMAGTALATFYQTIVGGRLRGPAANELLRLGLIDRSKVKVSRAGIVSRVQPGAVTGWQLAASDPYRWINEIFLPALARHNITDKPKILAELATVFRNRRGLNLVSILATQQERIEKDWRQIAGAQGLEAADTFMNKDVMTAWSGLTTQLKNFLQVAGGPLALPAADALKFLSDKIAQLAQLGREHPAVQKAEAGGLLAVIGTGLLGAYEAAAFGSRMLFGNSEFGKTASRFLMRLPLNAAKAPFMVSPWIDAALAAGYVLSPTAAGESDAAELRRALPGMRAMARDRVPSWLPATEVGDWVDASVDANRATPAKAELSGNATVTIVAPEWMELAVEQDGIDGVKVRGTTGSLGRSWPDVGAGNLLPAANR